MDDILFERKLAMGAFLLKPKDTSLFQNRNRKYLEVSWKLENQ